jgi:hypothetical protein
MYLATCLKQVYLENLYNKEVLGMTETSAKENEYVAITRTRLLLGRATV